jgi:hypothetical protein
VFKLVACLAWHGISSKRAKRPMNVKEYRIEIIFPQGPSPWTIFGLIMGPNSLFVLLHVVLDNVVRIPKEVPPAKAASTSAHADAEAGPLLLDNL